tara:strand:- start:5570 stop:5944 length:375 start_codon:yes stop_codon:yes gene_type:complete
MTFTISGTHWNCVTQILLGRNCDNTTNDYQEPDYDPCNDYECGSRDCLWSGLQIISEEGSKCPGAGAGDYAMNFKGGGACAGGLAMWDASFSSCCKATEGNCVKAASCSTSDASHTYSYAMEVL